MARICSACNKFASIEGDDPETDLSVDDDGEITGTVTVRLNSQCCGAVLSELELDFEHSITDEEHTHTVDNECEECSGSGKVDCGPCGGSGTVFLADSVGRYEDGPGEEECETCNGYGTLDCPKCEGTGEIELEEGYEIHGTEASFREDQAKTDRNGKPIKLARYRKTYYGADLTISVHCNRCDSDFEVEDYVQDQASSFDSY